MTCFIKDNKFLIINNQNIARALKKENKLSSITLHWFVLIIIFVCSLLSGQIEDIMTRKKEVTIEKDISDENM